MGQVTKTDTEIEDNNKSANFSLQLEQEVVMLIVSIVTSQGLSMSVATKKGLVLYLIHTNSVEPFFQFPLKSAFKRQ